MLMSSSSESAESNDLAASKRTGDSRNAVEMTWAFLSRSEACSHNAGQDRRFYLFEDCSLAGTNG
jgi:hypothetical protein